VSSPEERIIEIVQSSEAREIKFSVRFESSESTAYIEILEIPSENFFIG